MPVHIAITARDIFDAVEEQGSGEWLIGYRTAREIQKLLDIPPMVEWTFDQLMGRPVTLTTGFGLTFLPVSAVA